MYTAEIEPPLITSIQSFRCKSGNKVSNKIGDLENKIIHKASFTGLSKDINYKVRIRTILNGKTICQVVKSVESSSNEDILKMLEK